ncbi:MAG: MMPL family transporter [Candidatus Izimaplasma sp.]|nr:MMPL family transporter [Candidatus Izimaplasma bacterium]
MKSKIIIAIFVILVIVFGFLIPKVNINYNLQKYLPDDSLSARSIEEYGSQFGDSSNLILVFDEESIETAKIIKTNIAENDVVKNVVFVDDYLNEFTYSLIREQATDTQKAQLDGLLNMYISQGYSYEEALYKISFYFPEDFAESTNQLQTNYESFVSEDEVLFKVIFSENSYSKDTEAALNDIELLLENENYEYYLNGESASTIFTENAIARETTIITLMIIPIILILLLFLSTSYFDLVLFGIVAGAAIIINLGTNIFIPEISFITQSMAIALQLAISLDYIIFMLNAYHNEKADNATDEEALSKAVRKSRKPIIASALTTGVSFLALIFMKFSIGLDIGLVFFKAIMISLLTTIVLLPFLIKIFAKIINKTRKKTRVLKTAFLGKFAIKIKKLRYIFLVIVILAIVPIILLQGNTSFTYGASSFSASEGTKYYEDTVHIEEEFGVNNNLIILVEKDTQKEFELYSYLRNLDTIKTVEAGAYYKSILTDPAQIQYLTNAFYSEEYALFNLVLETESETEESYITYENIQNEINNIGFENAYYLGQTPIAYDLRDIIKTDFMVVVLIALVSVMLIIAISFKNLLLPIILTLVIEVSVFLTMLIPQAYNQDLIYLSYLIVSTILLGATIDYAILFSKRYMEDRLKFNKEESLKRAIKEASPSIITSALLFIVAGFAIYFVSSILAIKQIGLLIVIGVTMSLLFVLIILPQLIFVFDKWIIKANIDTES